MGKLVKWAVILILGYLLWTEGWPWLQSQLDRTGTSVAGSAMSSGGADPHRCVGLARQATEAFGDGATAFASERDVGGWMRFGGQVQSRISQADSACSCSGDACDLARQAMGELSALVSRLDGVVRGSSEEVFNPARELDEVYDLLDEAREALP